MFGEHSFTHGGATHKTSGPKELFDYFHNVLNMKCAGIRKPRSYSNVQLSNASGWMLAADTNVSKVKESLRGLLDAFGGCVAAPKVAAQLESLKFTPGCFFFPPRAARPWQ